MPAVLDSWPCPACSGQHALHYDKDMLTAGCTYEFTCPTTGTAIRFQTDEWTRIDRAAPRDSVPITLASN